MYVCQKIQYSLWACLKFNVLEKFQGLRGPNSNEFCDPLEEHFYWITFWIFTEKNDTSRWKFLKWLKTIYDW